jgi:hypothetical protein
MENKASVKDKPGTTAIKAYQDKQKNISRFLPVTTFFCIALIPITKELNRSNCGYQIHELKLK